jgi:hypothetical protein
MAPPPNRVARASPDAGSARQCYGVALAVDGVAFTRAFWLAAAAAPLEAQR